MTHGRLLADPQDTPGCRSDHCFLLSGSCAGGSPKHRDPRPPGCLPWWDGVRVMVLENFGSGSLSPGGPSPATGLLGNVLLLWPRLAQRGFHSFGGWSLPIAAHGVGMENELMLLVHRNGWSLTLELECTMPACSTFSLFITTLKKRP